MRWDGVDLYRLDLRLYMSYNSIYPGLIKDGKRLVEEIYDVHVYDGGADGVANTTADNTVFLRQGIFIP